MLQRLLPSESRNMEPSHIKDFRVNFSLHSETGKLHLGQDLAIKVYFITKILKYFVNNHNADEQINFPTKRIPWEKWDQ